MKSAETLLEELIYHVRPPRGVAVAITEWTSTHPSEPNWVAATGLMSAAKHEMFSAKVHELKRTDPDVDWSGVTAFVGPRRLALWLSEIER
jgi:hypothetical protein